MPDVDYKNYHKALVRELGVKLYCTLSTCFFIGSCQPYLGRLPPLILQMGPDPGFDFVVPASEYLVEGEMIGHPGTCYSGVQSSPMETAYILGSVFLRNYYSIYDVSNKRVGLALHKFSDANISLNDRGTRWYIWIAVAVVILAAILVVTLIYKKRKARRA